MIYDDQIDITNYKLTEKHTLGPAYNEHFNAWKSARCSRVLVVTELFNIGVNEMVSAWH